MMIPLQEMVQSKKFVACVAGVLSAFLGRVGFDLSPADITAIISPILAYIVGQGVSDMGKGASDAKPED